MSWQGRSQTTRRFYLEQSHRVGRVVVGAGVGDGVLTIARGRAQKPVIHSRDTNWILTVPMGVVVGKTVDG